MNSALAATVKKTNKISKFKRYIPLTLMAIPGIVYLIINNYIPMFGIIIAFKDVNYVDGIFGSPWSGFKNFEFLFKTRDAFEITRNTVLYNLVFIVLGLVLSVGLAILLNEVSRSTIVKVCQSTYVIPFMVSYTVVGYIVYAFFNPDYGFVNMMLKGMGREPVSWYMEPGYWPFILITVHMWKFLGYSSIIYLAAIVGIDHEYYEAAIIDGAKRMQVIWSITLPMIKPVIITLTLLAVGRIFYADFGLFYQTTLNSGLLYPTTNVIDTYVYRSLLATGEIGLASAAGFYQSAVGFIVIVLANLAVRKISREDALY